ncbi:RHS repeat protein [Xanthomonas sp. Kuri4-1]
MGFADGTSLSVTVKDYGQILTVTDETGAVTTLSYDAMGWLSRVAYPTGDSVVWNPWNSTFRPLTSTHYRPAGFVDGQWMQLQWRGNYLKINYFDAAWRPLSSTSMTGRISVLPEEVPLSPMTR